MELSVLLYISRVREPFTDEQLSTLSNRTIPRNQSNGVNSVLLYVSGQFIQALEGPRHKVDETFGRIARDPRHSTIEVLLWRPLEAYHFRGSSFGVLRAAYAEPLDRKLFRRISDRALDDKIDAAEAAMSLLNRVHERHNNLTSNAA